MQRRDFLFKLMVAVPLALWAACSKKSQKKPTAEEAKKLREQASTYHASVKYVSEGDPIAKTFGYVQVAENASPTVRRDKEGTLGQHQFCDSCQFYVKTEGKSYGACQLLQGRGVVKAKGWCKSWVPIRKMP